MLEGRNRRRYRLSLLRLLHRRVLRRKLVEERIVLCGVIRELARKRTRVVNLRLRLRLGSRLEERVVSAVERLRLRRRKESILCECCCDRGSSRLLVERLGEGVLAIRERISARRVREQRLRDLQALERRLQICRLRLRVWHIEGVVRLPSRLVGWLRVQLIEWVVRSRRSGWRSGSSHGGRSWIRGPRPRNRTRRST